jgi:hypothetical protein
LADGGVTGLEQNDASQGRAQLQLNSKFAKFKFSEINTFLSKLWTITITQQNKLSCHFHIIILVFFLFRIFILVFGFAVAALGAKGNLAYYSENKNRC